MVVLIGNEASSSSDSEADGSRTSKAKHYRQRPRRIIETPSSSSDNEELEPLNIDNIEYNDNTFTNIPQSDQNLLGKDPSVNKASGIPLNVAIVTRWSYYLTKGLESGVRDTLKEKWEIPVTVVHC